MRCALAILAFVLAAVGPAVAGQCPLLQTFEGAFKVFEGKDKALVFRAKYAINTEGAVTSYHKDDIRGQTKAINNICNGVNVTLTNGTSFPGGDNAACPGLRTGFAKARDLEWQAAAAPVVDFFAIAKRTCNAQKKCIPCLTDEATCSRLRRWRIRRSQKPAIRKSILTPSRFRESSFRSAGCS